MGWDAIKKIAINFAAAFIIAAIFTAVAPGAANKAMTMIGDRLGFGEPSILDFSVEPVTTTTAGTGARVTYSILGNLNDVEKILVYHKVAIPPYLGEPDKDGVYSYQGGQITGVFESKVYYRYVFAGSIVGVHRWLWQWSFDKKTWTSVETTEAPHKIGFDVKTLGQENKEIINYLNRENPNPKGIGDAYPNEPSLTTNNDLKTLKDSSGSVSLTTEEIDNNAWNQFTIELYISNGNVESREVVVKIGSPLDLP